MKNIGIIGAGAAGLASLHHVLQQGNQGTIFEQTCNIGGTWNYTDLTHVDEYGLPVHSSMYQGLMTNLPKEVMEYEDFPYEETIDKSYVDQKTVLKYMERYAEHFELYPYIKFLHHVVQVQPLPDEKWKLTVKSLKTNEISEHIFDALLVCIGHYSVPKFPNIPGMEHLGENAMHSHHYRQPEPYRGKKVLIIGAGPSGIDIARILGENIAQKVYISFGNTVFLKMEDYVIQKPLVKAFEGNKAIVADGSEVEFDNVIYCTGYDYVYPFMTPECRIKVENNWVKYLYKHIVNVEHPTMGIIGVPFKVCPFPLFDIQVKFFLEFIKNTFKISKDEMITDILQEIKKKAVPDHHAHLIGNELQRSYCDDLADTVNIKKVKPVIHNMFQYLRERNKEKRYRILNDEKFIEF